MKIALLGIDNYGAEVIKTIHAQYPTLKSCILSKSIINASDDIVQLSLTKNDTKTYLNDFLTTIDTLIITTCLDNDTSGKVATSLARQCAQNNINTLFFVSKPFSFEGNLKQAKMQTYIQDLVRISNCVLSIDNDMFIQNNKEAFSFNENLSIIYEVIAQSLKASFDLLMQQGSINIDFATLKELLSYKQSSVQIGLGKGYGENRVQQALNELSLSPLLQDIDSIANNDIIILNVTSDENSNMQNILDCIEQIKKFITEKSIFLLSVQQTNLENTMNITLLAIRVQNSFTNKKLVQAELPMSYLSTGEFDPSKPTIVNGQNLDIPTFLRKGKTLS